MKTNSNRGRYSPPNLITFWPKFKRPQNFRGVLGKIFGVTLLKPPTVCNRRPPLRTPLYPQKILGWVRILGFCPPIAKNLFVRF